MNKKLDYNLKYAKTHVKRIAFDLNREIDKDIISYLEENKPINKYLKELIRKEKTMTKVNITKIKEGELYIEYETKHYVPAIDFNTGEEFDYGKEQFWIGPDQLASTLADISKREGTPLDVVYYDIVDLEACETVEDLGRIHPRTAKAVNKIYSHEYGYADVLESDKETVFNDLKHDYLTVHTDSRSLVARDILWLMTESHNYAIYVDTLEQADTSILE